MRKLLPANIPCLVVLFVRRQDRWLDSYFNQMIKTNEIHEDVGSFLSRLLAGDDERLCRPDWLEHFQTWSDAFGSCNVVFYDEVAPDIFAAFLKAARFGSVPDLVDIDRAQVSLNVYELAYLLDLKAPDYREFMQRKSASEKASRQLGLKETRSILSDKDLARLRSAFEESNRRLIQTLDRDENQSPLQLDANRNSSSYCSLAEFYVSEPYAGFQKRADAIYARRNRRDRLKSFFK